MPGGIRGSLEDEAGLRMLIYTAHQQTIRKINQASCVASPLIHFSGHQVLCTGF